MQLTKIFSVILVLIISLYLTQGITITSKLAYEIDHQFNLVDVVVSSNKINSNTMSNQFSIVTYIQWPRT